MADKDRASSLRVRLGYEDHEWLAKLAQDEAVSMHALVKRAVRHFRYWQEQGEEAFKGALEIFEAERSGREGERRRRLYFQREYELQSRRLHNQLRDLRTKYESQLRDERNRRAKCEKQLRHERDGYDRQARAAEAHRNLLFSATVTKLLTLAIRSESDAEAMTAVEKARALHRKEQHSTSDTP